VQRPRASAHGVTGDAVLTRAQSTLLTVFGALALLLGVANATLATLNRSEQARLLQSQQFVQQTVPLETLYREIAKALAELAVKGNDRDLLALLAAQGINVTVNTPPAAAPKAAP